MTSTLSIYKKYTEKNNNVYKVHLLYLSDGRPGGICSDMLECNDTHSMCLKNICHCKSEYIEFNGNCIGGK